MRRSASGLYGFFSRAVSLRDTSRPLRGRAYECFLESSGEPYFRYALIPIRKGSKRLL